MQEDQGHKNNRFTVPPKGEHKNIETKYCGIVFRSRLEAKWAAMFDLLGWKWSYEPDDFHGWIPDFAIHGSRVVYVEVKPVYSFPPEVAEKMVASGCRNEMMIVGSEGPRWTDGGWLSIGWLYETTGNEGDEQQDGWWAEAAIGRWGSPPSGQIGFCHTEGGFDDRITGHYDGGHFGNGEVTKDEIESFWREACNRTRWMPGK